MRSGKILGVCLSVLALNLLQTMVSAQTTYFGQDNGGYPTSPLTNSSAAEANFLAALSAPGTETYDALSGINPSLTFGTTGVTATTTNSTIFSSIPAYVTAPNILTTYGNNGNTAPPVFTFNTPIVGFGTYIADAGTGGGALSLLLENTTNPAFTQTVAVGNSVQVSANELFFGVIDAARPFNRVSILTTDSGDGIALDSTSVGTSASAVPEPGSIALLAGMGTVGAAFLRRRKQAQKVV